MSDHDYDESEQMFVPTPDRADIMQEAAIYEWQHDQRPSLKLLYKKLQRQQSLSFGFFPPSENLGNPFAQQPISSRETFEQLIEWTLDQSGEVQSIVLTWLDDPAKEEVTSIILKLQGLGVTLLGGLPTTRTPKSVAVLILEELAQGPRERKQIYELIQRLYQTKRPNATARQALRRLSGNGIIEEVSGVFSLTK